MAPEQLSKWIDTAGISQGEFAKRLNKASRKVTVDQSEVSRWVRRKRLPNADETAAIEKVTGIPKASWAAISLPSWSE